MPRLIGVFAGCTLIVLMLSCRGSYYHYFRMVYSPAPESHYIYFLGSRKKSNLKTEQQRMNNRETNEKTHSNSTRAKFVNKIPYFMRKYLSVLKHISK